MGPKCGCALYMAKYGISSMTFQEVNMQCIYALLKSEKLRIAVEYGNET